MNNVGTYAVEDGIGVITINSPPVNALGQAVRSAIVEGVRRLIADHAVKAIVLICEGEPFSPAPTSPSSASRRRSRRCPT